eukprot:s6918_g1.t1
MVWTSFALNSGTTMPIHRDVNNDGSYPNGSVGFGNYKGGELWIEKGGFQEGYTGKLSERVDDSGRVLEGVELDIYKRGVIFSPKAWHGTCKWEGERWVLTAYEGWVQYFGHPRCLRLDPAGAFRSAAVEEWCDKHSIFLDVVPGEAHWKIGVVESAVQGVKEVMTKLCQYDPELTPSEALAEAVVTFNHKELVRGYSPAQHILGQAPDETGRFIPRGNQVSRSTLDTVVKSNILLATAKAKQNYKMKIHAFKESDDLTMVMWVDAANGNRVDGGSTQGLFLGMAPKTILSGSVTGVSPLAWHSQKIDRTCRSPGSAEAQAAVNGEDCLYYGRYEWSELLHGRGDLRDPDSLVSKTGG